MQWRLTFRIHDKQSGCVLMNRLRQTLDVTSYKVMENMIVEAYRSVYSRTSVPPLI